MEVIEIPFGAKDSELQEWTYTIPDGMEAEIRDGKVVIKKNESEDEKIRKDLVSFLWAVANGTVKSMPAAIMCQEWIAWLEKQKYDRMKPIYDAKESFESALEKAWNDYHNGYENVDKLEDDYVECAHAKGFREGYLFGIEKQKEQKPIEWSANESARINLLAYIKENQSGTKKWIDWLEKQKEQKPVEWSKEDEHRCGDAIYFLETAKKHYADTSEIELTIEWLKSLRPQSKDEIHKEKNEKPKHTEVWVEGRTIFEQDANTFVNTEEEPEAKLTGWVARDMDGEICVYEDYPERIPTQQFWFGLESRILDQKSFPDLKWEDEPVEVELTIKRK